MILKLKRVMVLVSQQPVYLCGRTLSWSRQQRPRGVEDGAWPACFRAVRPGASEDKMGRGLELSHRIALHCYV